MVKPTNRRWCHKTKTKKNKTQKIKEIVKDIRQKKEASAEKINSFLCNVPNFIGCFADDELKNLSIQSFPAFLICNLDHSSQIGSHWICLRVDRKTVEIFDPLGFNTELWPKLPFFLLNYLRNLSFQKQILFSRHIQPIKSLLCGYYCIFYVLTRQNHSFNQIVKMFSLHLYKNDSVLTYLFNKSIK